MIQKKYLIFFACSLVVICAHGCKDNLSTKERILIHSAKKELIHLREILKDEDEGQSFPNIQKAEKIIETYDSGSSLFDREVRYFYRRSSVGKSSQEVLLVVIFGKRKLSVPAAGAIYVEYDHLTVGSDFKELKIE